MLAAQQKTTDQGGVEPSKFGMPKLQKLWITTPDPLGNWSCITHYRFDLSRAVGLDGWGSRQLQALSGLLQLTHRPATWQVLL